MGDKIRLLLVEDEQTLAGIIADTLSEKGFEVTVAHDGEADQADVRLLHALLLSYDSFVSGYTRP